MYEEVGESRFGLRLVEDAERGAEETVGEEHNAFLAGTGDGDVETVTVVEERDFLRRMRNP